MATTVSPVDIPVVTGPESLEKATTMSPVDIQVETGPESLEKATQLVTEFGLPNGLLPLQDVVECGYNKQTGFVWITQKKAIVHKFDAISKQVSYGQKITAFLEKGRLKKLTGVKAKELLLWVAIVDISATEEEADREEKLFFRSFASIGKSFPAKAFVRAAAPSLVGKA